MVSRLGFEPRALALKWPFLPLKLLVDSIAYVDFAKSAEVHSSNDISSTCTIYQSQFLIGTTSFVCSALLAELSATRAANVCSPTNGVETSLL